MQHTSTSTKSKLIFSIPSGYIQYIQQHYSHLFSCPPLTRTETRVELLYACISPYYLYAQKISRQQCHSFCTHYKISIVSNFLTQHCTLFECRQHLLSSPFKKKRKRSYLPRPLFVLSSNPMLLTFTFLPFRLALYFAHSFALLSFALFSFSIDLYIMEKNKQTVIACVKKKK